MLKHKINIVLIQLLFISASCVSQNKVIIPNWVQDAIFYQIFPERFANGDSTNDPQNVKAWGGKPEYNNYFGGDLAGVIQNLDYLQELGINALYLNPIFESNSNHKYHTKDYFKIDPQFGNDSIFKMLLSECHKRGIKVVIDGVFNHTGIDFFAFQDIVKNENNSKYLKWYDVHSFPVQLPPAKPNYEAWWGMGDLPKLMADNPEVRKYIFEATQYWMKMGLDGWRLDVPNEMSHDFWIQWRTLVKGENPDAYIVGEIWDDASAWLKGNQFDAVMNYRFRGACVGWIALENRNTFQFDSILSATRKDYPNEVNYALQNLIGSHDTERFLTLCKGNIGKAKLAALFQMTYVGAPMIYYGDEIGMMGGRDPDCRRTMILDTLHWNSDLREFYKKVIRIRDENPVFRKGDYRTIIVDATKNIIAFRRDYESNHAIVILNNSPNCQNLVIDNLSQSFQEWYDVLNEKHIKLQDGKLSLESLSPYSGAILLNTKRK
ncbi:MAG: glycoside hydrolase family 13 protein [Bacteroidota bacterium]|nr:glycoside hydrolase family 13 protein [Bacteroidota bacterium]